MNSDLAQKYWDVANAIVAFSVLQMLAFLYALANKEFRAQVAQVRSFVIAATAICSALYALGVVGCYVAELKLRGEVESGVSTLLFYTVLARIVIIVLASLSGVAMLLALTRMDGSN